MGFADYLKNELPNAPEWLGSMLIRLNHFKDIRYTPAMKSFKQNIKNLDERKLLIDTANYAIEHVPYYRERYSGVTITSVEQFKSVFQLIDKAEVMKQPEKFISDEASAYSHVTTSGTSGKPLDLCVPNNRYITEMAFITKVWQSIGWNYDAMATYRRHHLDNGRDFLINPISKEYIFDAFRPDDDYMLTIYNTMRRHGVTTLYSYPSTAYELLKRFDKLGLDTSFIKYALLTSEGVTPLQHALIEGKLGIKISSFYGHTEKLVLARSLNGGLSDFVVEQKYGLCEIVDNESVTHDEKDVDAYGEIVGSTYYNRVMPLLRYRTGDYAQIKGTIKDTDGETKMLLKSIEGRRSKSIIYRHDGTAISEAMLTFHGDILTHLDGLQYIQDRRGYLRACIIPNAQFNDNDLALMRKTYSEAMLGDEYYSIEKVDKVIIQPNGKFLPLINTTI
jgi:phenylacetate-CoA ligase